MSVQIEPKGISAGSQLLQRIDTKIVHNCELQGYSTKPVLKDCWLSFLMITIFKGFIWTTILQFVSKSLALKQMTSKRKNKTNSKITSIIIAMLRRRIILVHNSELSLKYREIFPQVPWQFPLTCLAIWQLHIAWVHRWTQQLSYSSRLEAVLRCEQCAHVGCLSLCVPRNGIGCLLANFSPDVHFSPCREMMLIHSDFQCPLSYAFQTRRKSHHGLDICSAHEKH